MVDILNPPLRRSREHRIVAGVLGGIAEYYDLDVTLLRVLYVIVSVVSVAFPGTIVYLILWILIPARKRGEPTPVRA